MLRTVRRIAAAGAAAIVGVSALAALPAHAAPMLGDALFADQLHLVTMTGPGTAGYDGAQSEADYRAGLLRRQDAALAAIGADAPLVRWTTALSGMAVEIDSLQADRLRSLPGVQLVEVDRLRSLAGAPSASGAAASAKPGRGGEGTVIGFVDSGIDSRSAAFADTARLGALPDSFTGECATGSRSDCTAKVVTARHFIDAFGAANLRTGAAVSAHDDEGHGTMVAALAAGSKATPTGRARQISKDFVGAAPNARIAAYKACWQAPDPADDGCASADVVSAIDAAVGDGVDVLNLSVAGQHGLDTVDLALLGAAESDIVVVAAAGNTGGITGHDAPWVTTVGAVDTVSHRAALVLTDGTRLPGTLTMAGNRTDREVVLARSIPAPGTKPAQAALCPYDSLDAAGADGKIVVCERGEVPRLEKSHTVHLAGGAGVVLVNGVGEDLTADLHSVPTLNVSATTGRKLRGQLGGGKVRGHMVGTTTGDDTRQLGWSATGNPDAATVKPDLMAPGLGRLTATTRALGRWDLLSGTSAAAADVSGMAAALRSRQPDWSAARIRSALSTTSSSLWDPLSSGAGLADLKAAQRAGLVQDVDASAWRQYAEGELADLNLPSVVMSSPGQVRRQLTNVRARAAYWSVSVRGFDRHTVEVFPRAVQLEPGETATVRIVATRKGPARRSDSGFVVWRDDAGNRVRVPVVIDAD